MWTGRQRRRLLGIARSAGLRVDDHTLIDEPIAAGVAWVNNRIARSGQGVRGQLLAFDMGGGTLDVAVLDVHAELGHDPKISVLSSWGVDEAGDVLDERLAAELERQLVRHGTDLDDLPNAAAVRTVVRQAAKEAKERLSDDSTRLSRSDTPASTSLSWLCPARSWTGRSKASWTEQPTSCGQF